MKQQTNNKYNWTGVLEFLYSEHQNLSLKENLWFLEKKELNDRIKELEGKLAAAEAISTDLKNKNQMLQYCLRQLKSKASIEKDKIQGQAQIPIPQRRPKPNKANISKILCSLGIPNLLQDINKDLKSKSVNPPLKIDIATIQQKKSARIQSLSKRPSSYKEIAILQDHQDGVRDICFLNDKQYMVSVSEDSTMKIWNVDKPKQKIDCIATLRQHTGPIFTAIEGEGLIFTGGMEGVIRCWNLPRKFKDTKGCLVGSWSNSQDQKLQPIWQLIYDQEHKLIISTSSQIAIRAFQINIEENFVDSRYKSSFVYQSKSNEQEDIPTAICMHRESLFAGYVNSNALIQFNLQTQKVISQLGFPSDGQISTNKIISNNQLLLGAFQDNMIRVFDKSKIIHSFQAHDESVMSMCFVPGKPYEFFSCGQDGYVKLWDMRKFQCIGTFNAHKKKYDEAVHCISAAKNGLTASGGADAIIKLFLPE